MKKLILVPMVCLVLAATAHADVTGRYVFYNNSAFDQVDPWDDGAIAPDKFALTPGQTATFANYTSYSKGINGIMVDILGLGSSALTASDFFFHTGNNNDPTTWSVAPVPSISVRTGAGSGGSDRITLIWADNAIQNEWLQIGILNTTATGLSAPDVFYFGNAIGETGNDPSNAAVTAMDELLVINAMNAMSGVFSVGIDHDLDFNRDGWVSPADAQIVIDLLKQDPALDPLNLITVPMYDPGSGQEPVVPVPGAALLGVLGLGCAGLRLRRRRAR